MDNVRFYSIREFYNKHNNDAVACNWNNNGIVIPCVRFGNTLVPISKECQGASGKEIFKNPKKYAIVEFVEGEDKSKKYRIIPIDCTNKYSLPEKNEVELHIENAMSLLRQGVDGDKVYHPLYKAWSLSIENPNLLNGIHNYSLVGNGFLTLISFGTISSIDDMEQLASLAYLFISKSLKECDNAYDYKNRVLLIDSHFINHEEYFKDVRDAFQYTVSEAIHYGERRNPLSSMMFSDEINDRVALCRMEYHDLMKMYGISSINGLHERKKELEACIGTGRLFEKEETEQSIILKGAELHKKSTFIS